MKKLNVAIVGAIGAQISAARLNDNELPAHLVSSKIMIANSRGLATLISVAVTIQIVNYLKDSVIDGSTECLRRFLNTPTEPSILPTKKEPLPKLW